ncbi:MAG: hypothetical protein LC790_13310 [Actinobacteria bacterium]|nr:hypothetical protein [Actinomycetota bacterium]
MRRAMKLGASLETLRADVVPAGSERSLRRDELDEHRERQDRRPPPHPERPLSRCDALAGIAGVTVIEAVAIYVWLRLHVDGHPWWGLVSLVVGQVVETALFKMVIDREGRRRWGPVAQGGAGPRHLRKLQMRLGAAGNAEVGIWVLWLALAQALGQPVAAGVLLVLMHVKHQVETVAVRDARFRTVRVQGVGWSGRGEKRGDRLVVQVGGDRGG